MSSAPRMAGCTRRITAWRRPARYGCAAPTTPPSSAPARRSSRKASPTGRMYLDPRAPGRRGPARHDRRRPAQRLHLRRRPHPRAALRERRRRHPGLRRFRRGTAAAQQLVTCDPVTTPAPRFRAPAARQNVVLVVMSSHNDQNARFSRAVSGGVVGALNPAAEDGQPLPGRRLRPASDGDDGIGPGEAHLEVADQALAYRPEGGEANGDGRDGRRLEALPGVGRRRRSESPRRRIVVRRQAGRSAQPTAVPEPESRCAHQFKPGRRRATRAARRDAARPATTASPRAR